MAEQSNGNAKTPNAVKVKRRRNKKSNVPLITYGDIQNMSQELLNAPELPKEQKFITGGKGQIFELLKDGIIEYLKKGYSTLAATQFINEKLPSVNLTETDIRSLLPFVTKKRKQKKQLSDEAKQASTEKIGNAKSVIPDSEIAVPLPYEMRLAVKQIAPSLKWNNTMQKWSVATPSEKEKILEKIDKTFLVELEKNMMDHHASISLMRVKLKWNVKENDREAFNVTLERLRSKGLIELQEGDIGHESAETVENSYVDENRVRSSIVVMTQKGLAFAQA
jgi:hypothetical protein